LVISTSDDEGDVLRLPSKTRRCMLESRCEIRWQMVGVEDRGTSLERRRDSVLQRHIEGVKSCFSEEDNLDRQPDPVWSGDNKQTTSNTGQERKIKRTESSKGRTAAVISFSTQA
jgi:hypothetical protein